MNIFKTAIEKLSAQDQNIALEKTALKGYTPKIGDCVAHNPSGVIGRVVGVRTIGSRLVLDVDSVAGHRIRGADRVEFSLASPGELTTAVGRVAPKLEVSLIESGLTGQISQESLLGEITR
jgi:hypothetical protein